MTTQAHQVNICNQAPQATIDQDRLRQGVLLVLQEHGIQRAVIGLAIVTDTAMQQMNRQYLNHDYATDVLSFPLSSDGDDVLEGEIAISVDTALQRAKEYGWDAENELLLYAIHGTLHLVGLSDQTPEDRRNMRFHEKTILAKMSIVCPEEILSVASDTSVSPDPISDHATRTCTDSADRRKDL